MDSQQARIVNQSSLGDALKNNSLIPDRKKASSESATSLTNNQSQRKSGIEPAQRNTRQPPRKVQATSSYPHQLNHSQHQTFRSKSQRESITSADYLLYFDAKKRNDELTLELSEKQRRIEDLEFLVKTQKSFIDEFMKNVHLGQSFTKSDRDVHETMQDPIPSAPESRFSKALQLHKQILPKKRTYPEEQSSSYLKNPIHDKSLPIQMNLEADTNDAEVDIIDKELVESTEDICWSIFSPLATRAESISDTDLASTSASSSLESILDVLTGMFNIWSSRLRDSVLQISYQHYTCTKTKSTGLSSITYWFEDESSSSSSSSSPNLFSSTSYFSTLNPVSFFFFLSALYQSDSGHPYSRYFVNLHLSSAEDDISLDLYVRRYLTTFTKNISSYAISTSPVSTLPSIWSSNLSPLEVFEAFDVLEAEQIVAATVLRILLFTRETAEESQSFFNKHPKASFHWLQEELADQNHLLIGIVGIANAGSPEQKPQGKRGKSKTESKASASGIPPTTLSSWELTLLREIQIPQAPLRVLTIAYSMGMLQAQLVQKTTKEHPRFGAEQLEKVAFTSLSLLCNPSVGYCEQTVITVITILSSFMRVVDAKTIQGEKMDVFGFSSLNGQKLQTLYTLVSTLEFLLEDFFGNIVASHFELCLQSENSDTAQSSQSSYGLALKAEQKRPNDIPVPLGSIGRANPLSFANLSVFDVLWSNAKLFILHETQSFLREILQALSTLLLEKEAFQSVPFSSIFSHFTLHMPSSDLNCRSPSLKYCGDFVVSSRLDEIIEIIVAQKRSDLLMSLLAVSAQKSEDRDVDENENQDEDKGESNSSSNLPCPPTFPTLPYFFQVVLDVMVRNSPLMYVRSVALPAIILPGLSKHVKEYISQLSSTKSPFFKNHMLNNTYLQLLSHISAIFTAVSLCLSNYSLLLRTNDLTNASSNSSTQTTQTMASLVSVDELLSVSLAAVDVVRIILSSHDKLVRDKGSQFVVPPVSLISSATLSLPLGLSEQLDSSHVFVEPVEILDSSQLLSLVEQGDDRNMVNDVNDVKDDELHYHLRISQQIQDEVCRVVNQLQVYFDSLLQSLLPPEYQTASVMITGEDVDL